LHRVFGQRLVTQNAKGEPVCDTPEAVVEGAERIVVA
jgi:hypothetical protein